MAATRGDVTGYDRVRAKEVHRLGSEAVQTVAATWNTFVTAFVKKDGSGHVKVEQNGKLIHTFKFDKE